MTDNEYLAIAVELAKKGCGFVNPNPMVGAVIVKNDEIIGIGYHEKYGELHAERNVLKNCTSSPDGATMYVTLEPCCHYGKTTPCTNAIIKSGISRVVIGSSDPNPLVAGKGVQMLKQHGIEVVENILKKECDGINEVYFHFVKTKTPFVVMKYAMTLDGKIATVGGKSKWITGEVARQRVQKDRHKYSAIMVGVGTVKADNPLLTCRLEHSKNPIRIICDTHLRTPLDSNITQTASEVRTILATCVTDSFRISPYLEKGCQIITCKKKEDHIDLNDLMIKLGKEKIDSILLEGGGMLNWSALKAGIVKKVQTYIAPKIFGGDNAKGPIGGLGVNNTGDAYVLENAKIISLGDDFLIESEVVKNVHRNC